MERGRHQFRRLSQFFQRRPAVLFTFLIALGIGIANVLPIKPALWLGAAAGLLVIAIFVRWAIPRAGLIVGVTFLVGVSAAQIARFKFPADSIGQYATYDERLAELELAIDQPPRLVMPSPAELRLLPPKQNSTPHCRENLDRKIII